MSTNRDLKRLLVAGTMLVSRAEDLMGSEGGEPRKADRMFGDPGNKKEWEALRKVITKWEKLADEISRTYCI